MIKKRHIAGLILICAVFCTILSLAPVNACGPDGPPDIIDEYSKTYYHKSKQYKVNWETYYYSHSKHKNKNEIYLEYKVLSKNSKVVKGYGRITLEKISKNKMKISEEYSASENIKITYKKTKLKVNQYYQQIYKPKLIKSIKPQMTVISYCIHKGKTKSKKITDINNSLYGTRNKLKWKTYSYSHSSKIVIELEYVNYGYYGSSYSNGNIKIKKIAKNKLKIRSEGLQTFNGHELKNKNEYVKTSLSPEKYYLKIYKAKIKDSYYKSINYNTNTNNKTNNNNNIILIY